MDSNFEGNVLIIFEDQNGKDPAFANTTRLYDIGPSGILRTKFKPNYGQFNITFYDKGESSNRIIPYVVRQDNDSSAERVVFNKITGKFYSKEQKKDIHFELFSVGRRSKLDSITSQRTALILREVHPSKVVL